MSAFTHEQQSELGRLLAANEDQGVQATLIRQLQGATRGPPVVTALPANPADGQVIDYLADATNGVVWRLKYRAASASAFKWEFVGGGWLYAHTFANTTQVLPSTANTWQDLTGAPSLVNPLAGDWRFQFEINAAGNPSVSSTQVQGAVGIGAASAGSADGSAGVSSSFAAQFDYMNFATVRRAVGVAINQTWKPRMASVTASLSLFIGDMFMFLQPIRVG